MIIEDTADAKLWEEKQTNKQNVTMKSVHFIGSLIQSVITISSVIG